jgi:hypothetical protein
MSLDKGCKSPGSLLGGPAGTGGLAEVWKEVWKETWKETNKEM